VFFVWICHDSHLICSRYVVSETIGIFLIRSLLYIMEKAEVVPNLMSHSVSLDTFLVRQTDVRSVPFDYCVTKRNAAGIRISNHQMGDICRIQQILAWFGVSKLSEHPPRMIYFWNIELFCAMNLYPYRNLTVDITLISLGNNL